MKLQQKSLDQTGIAIIILNGMEKQIPLFSLEPCGEANEIVQKYFPQCERIKHVYITNNLLTYPIEKVISDYRTTHENVLPEDYMEELVSGFPYVVGREPAFKKAYYA